MASSSCFAENWVATNPKDDIRDYVDTTSIASVGKGIIKARVKSLYPNDMMLEDIAYNQIIALEYYRCDKRQIAHKSIEFLKDGKSLYSAEKSEAEITFEDVTPGYPVNLELEFVCQQAGKQKK